VGYLQEREQEEARRECVCNAACKRVGRAVFRLFASVAASCGGASVFRTAGVCNLLSDPDAGPVGRDRLYCDPDRCLDL